MKLRMPGLLFVVLLSTASLGAQLPPVSWTCPMHPDVLEETKGACPVCAMALEPIRLISRYTCPVHAVIDQSEPGTCKICKRDLVPMTSALTWTCAGHPQINQIDPGKCPDGTAMTAKYTARAHGDHNPKHGGTFFMAPDNWHHIEGTYPAEGRFRVYIYDDYSRPLPMSDARSVRGRIVTKETFDPKTGRTTDLASAPLVLARNGSFFEAHIERLVPPAKMVAKIAFRAGDKESRFDFSFPAFSKELPTPAVPPSSTSSSAAGAARPAQPQQTGSGAVPALIADLKARQAELAALVKSGDFGGVYYPALQAKDLALQIQKQHTPGMPDQEGLEKHVRELVLAAYQLDNYGDLGDGEKINQAFGRFNSAISALETLVGSP